MDMLQQLYKIKDKNVNLRNLHCDILQTIGRRELILTCTCVINQQEKL